MMHSGFLDAKICIPLPFYALKAPHTDVTLMNSLISESHRSQEDDIGYI